MNEYIDRIVVGGVEYPLKDANSYIKPATGIPATDLAESVQISLDKADTALQSEDLAPIEELIPAQATAENQLADKNFVNSSIATATADFKGTYNSLAELQQVAANANDYGYVVSTDAAGNVIYNRYKYVEGTGWTFEYALNNSSFTAAEWAAIQSGITAVLVTKLQGLPATPYVKPNDGIPSTDLASGVIPDVSAFITKTVNDLVNYYTKQETYTKAEVVALINAVQQFTYESVSTLPTASAQTMHKIYLVPSADPQTQNVKDEYITIESSGTYSWEQIGSTAIDLSGYVTITMLNAALADYVTSTALATALAGKQDKIDSDHKLDYSLIANTPTELEITTQIIDSLWAAAS